ncbi:hypothetical protein [Streptomyces sp. WL006]|uniref:hypothetical protein n=1 Tax=Streptomyces sp. WL006 TaxID=3423915 RepID=UPI003F6AF131
MRRTLCADCRRPVLWTRTDAGKQLAVDPEPDPAGNAAVHRDGLGVTRSRRPTEELPKAPWEKLHVPHVATCPTRKRPKAASTALPAGVADLTAFRRTRERP